VTESTRGAVAMRAARCSLIAARYGIIVHIARARALSSGVIAAHAVYANYETFPNRGRGSPRPRTHTRNHQGQGRSRSVRGASTSSGKPRLADLS